MKNHFKKFLMGGLGGAAAALAAIGFRHLRDSMAAKEAGKNDEDDSSKDQDHRSDVPFYLRRNRLSHPSSPRPAFAAVRRQMPAAYHHRGDR